MGAKRKIPSIYQSNTLVLESSYMVNAFDRNVLNAIQRNINPFDPSVRDFFSDFDWDRQSVPTQYKEVLLTYEDVAKVFDYRMTDYKRVDERLNALKNIHVGYKNETVQAKGVFVSDVYHFENDRKWKVLLGDVAIKHFLAIFLKEHNGFTQIYFAQSNGLKRKYAKRWYDILSALKTRNFKRTVFELDQIKYMFQIDESWQWHHIKQRVIDPAFKEISESTDVDPSYEIIKSGKRIVAVEIYIDKMVELSMEIPFEEKGKGQPRRDVNRLEPEENMARYKDRLIVLGFNSTEINRIIDLVPFTYFMKDINYTYQLIQETIEDTKKKNWYQTQIDRYISNLGHPTRSKQS